MPLRDAAPSPPQLPNSLHRLAKEHNSRTDHPTSCLDMAMKTGSQSIEMIMRRRRNLFAEFVARMKDTRLPKCAMFGEMVGSVWAAWGG